jgi:hypothetical protein
MGCVFDMQDPRDLHASQGHDSKRRKKKMRNCRFDFLRYGHKEERREGKVIVKTTRASARCVSVSRYHLPNSIFADCCWSSLQPDLSPLVLVRSNAKPTQRVSPWQPCSAAEADSNGTDRQTACIAERGRIKHPLTPCPRACDRKPSEHHATHQKLREWALREHLHCCKRRDATDSFCQEGKSPAHVPELFHALCDAFPHALLSPCRACTSFKPISAALRSFSASSLAMCGVRCSCARRLLFLMVPFNC